DVRAIRQRVDRREAARFAASRPHGPESTGTHVAARPQLAEYDLVTVAPRLTGTVDAGRDRRRWAAGARDLHQRSALDEGNPRALWSEGRGARPLRAGERTEPRIVQRAH